MTDTGTVNLRTDGKSAAAINCQYTLSRVSRVTAAFLDEILDRDYQRNTWANRGIDETYEDQATTNTHISEE